MKIEEDIKQWILNDLDGKRDFLGGLPSCPYAAESLVENKIKILEAKPSDVFKKIHTCIDDFFSLSESVVVIAIKNWKALPVLEVKNFVNKCRQESFKKDVWLLCDHPEIKETVHGFCFNHGGLLLFMIQSLSELVMKSRELQQTDYYSHWPKGYFDEVVLLRENFYNQLIKSKGKSP